LYGLEYRTSQKEKGKKEMFSYFLAARSQRDVAGYATLVLDRVLRDKKGPQP